MATLQRIAPPVQPAPKVARYAKGKHGLSCAECGALAVHRLDCPAEWVPLPAPPEAETVPVVVYLAPEPCPECGELHGDPGECGDPADWPAWTDEVAVGLVDDEDLGPAEPVDDRDDFDVPDPKVPALPLDQYIAGEAGWYRGLGGEAARLIARRLDELAAEVRACMTPGVATIGVAEFEARREAMLAR